MPSKAFRAAYRGVWVNPHANSDGTHDRKVRAEFLSEFDASAWLYGMPASGSFVVEDADGNEVVIRGITERDGRLSHTYTVLASLDKAEREERQREIESSGFVKGQLVRAVKPARAWGRSGRPAENPPPSPGRIFKLSPDPTSHPVIVEWRTDDEQETPIYGWFELDGIEAANG